MSMNEQHLILDTSSNIGDIIPLVFSKIEVTYKTHRIRTNSFPVNYGFEILSGKVGVEGCYYQDDRKLDELVELMQLKNILGAWALFSFHFYYAELQWDQYYLISRFVNALLRLESGDCVFTDDSFCIPKLIRKGGLLLVDKYVLGLWGEKDLAEIDIPYKMEILPRLTGW